MEQFEPMGSIACRQQMHNIPAHANHAVARLPGELILRVFLAYKMCKMRESCQLDRAYLTGRLHLPMQSIISSTRKIERLVIM